MIRILDLVDVADAFRALVGVEREVTLSYRVFGDSKVLTNIRNDGEMTVGRFNAAMLWFATNWPANAEKPAVLLPYVPPTPDKKDAA
jgi:hypothetical protein